MKDSLYTSEDIQRDLGRHEEAIERLKSDVETIKGDVKAVLEIISRGKGALHVGTKVATAMGYATVSFLAAIVTLIVNYWTHRGN